MPETTSEATVKNSKRPLEAEPAQNKIAKSMKKYKKKSRKWVDWQAANAGDSAVDNTPREPFNPADRVKRRKCAMLVSYSGAKYMGMQRNPGAQTIEEELFKAMLKHAWITPESFEQIQLAMYQRAARTDKGVSATRQVCSLKLPDSLDLKALNDELPSDIRVIAVQRVTKGFNSKDQCNARTYSYTLPTIAFAPKTLFQQQRNDWQNYRADEAQLSKLSDCLRLFEGCKNFHNFTSKKKSTDPSAKRYIISFTSTPAFICPSGIEFITLKVKGQSFMIHQIRKMVGLAIAIVRGDTTVEFLQRALSQELLNVPRAPSLGLVLDTVHYERYNDRYGSDGVHEPLTWAEQEPEIDAFAEQQIYANIYKTEAEEQSMLLWLDTLALHAYDGRLEFGNEQCNDTNEGDDDDGDKIADDDDT